MIMLMFMIIVFKYVGIKFDFVGFVVYILSDGEDKLCF